jgi:hypothetical protein
VTKIFAIPLTTAETETFEFSHVKVKDSIANNLISTFPKFLHAQHMRLCSSVTSDVVFKLIENCGTFLLSCTLEFSKDFLCDAHLDLIGTKCHFLKLFNIQRCALVSDIGLCNVITNNKSLQKLHIGYCVLVTDITIDTLTENCKYINFLNISHTQITNNSIHKIATNCRFLESLNIAHCDNVTCVNSIQKLITNCVFLTHIDIQNQELITKLGVDICEKFYIELDSGVCLFLCVNIVLFEF